MLINSGQYNRSVLNPAIRVARAGLRLRPNPPTPAQGHASSDPRTPARCNGATPAALSTSPPSLVPWPFNLAGVRVGNRKAPHPPLYSWGHHRPPPPFGNSPHFTARRKAGRPYAGIPPSAGPGPPMAVRVALGCARCSIRRLRNHTHMGTRPGPLHLLDCSH